MQRTNEIIARAKELLASGEVNRVLGWRKGEYSYDQSPAVFTESNIDELVYDDFSTPNLSKYLVKETLKEGKIAVLMKPSDSYSLNQLLTEHRVKRENIYVIGIPAESEIDLRKIEALGVKGITDIEADETNVTIKSIYGDKTVAKSDVLLDRSINGKGTKHVIYDELLCCTEDEEAVNEDTTSRFDQLKEIEAMSSDERYEFWRSELSKCIRCNACRNVCPACTCRTCVFDNPDSQVDAKANTTSFEENMFHIIRAFHVAGRCTDCGECSRVCHQNIPLHLLNRKFIKDMNENYGEYQAGAVEGSRAPLVSFTTEDIEPNAISDGGKA